MRTPIYYGRCHKEGEGSKVYFIVNKLAPKMNAVDNDEDAGSDTTVNATKSSKNATLSKNATKAVNGTVNGTANGTNSTNLTQTAPGGAKGSDGDDSLDGATSAFDEPKEKVIVNSVSEKMGKDEIPPPPPPKYTDGLEHKQQQHIKINAGSGSYAEAVKEFYIDEARKEKEKREKALAKRQAYLKAE